MNRFATSIAIVLACGAAACGGSEPPATTQTQQPATAEQAPAPPPAVGLYVTNEASGELSMIDAATQSVVATIPLGTRPRGVVGSPDGTLLYIALSGSPFAPPGVDEKTLPPPDRSADGIGVVDVRTLKLQRVMPVGTDPEQLAVSRDGARLFVSNEDAATVSVVDAAEGRIEATVKVGGEPEGVEVAPDGTVVYATSEEDGVVFAIDAARVTVLGKF